MRGSSYCIQLLAFICLISFILAVPTAKNNASKSRPVKQKQLPAQKQLQAQKQQAMKKQQQKAMIASTVKLGKSAAALYTAIEKLKKVRNGGNATNASGLPDPAVNETLAELIANGTVTVVPIENGTVAVVDNTDGTMTLVDP